MVARDSKSLASIPMQSGGTTVLDRFVRVVLEDGGVVRVALATVEQRPRRGPDLRARALRAKHLLSGHPCLAPPVSPTRSLTPSAKVIPRESGCTIRGTSTCAGMSGQEDAMVATDHTLATQRIEAARQLVPRIHDL